MKSIYLGKTETGETVSLDFKQEAIRCVLLAGATGSGKSVFHSHMYRELVAKNTPAELGFLIMDMTKCEDFSWLSDFLIQPIIFDPNEAITVLENIKNEKPTLLIHIEECDMVYRNRARFEKAIEQILKDGKNVILIYSTSRIDSNYLAEWLEQYIDLRVVFQVRSREDSQLLLGDDSATTLTIPGERIMLYKDKKIKCIPL